MLNKDLVKAESYAERRKLFKNVWDAAMVLDDKDVDPKTKVIKTLQMDEEDKSAAKRKRQRLINLRNVCTKILDFCEKQEAEDVYREQLAAEGITLGSKEDIPARNKRKILKPRKRKLKQNKESIPTSDQVNNNTIEEMSLEDDCILMENSRVNKKTRNIIPRRKPTVKNKRKIKKETEEKSLKVIEEPNNIISLLDADIPGDGYSQDVNISGHTSQSKKSTVKRSTRHSKPIKKMSKKSKMDSQTPQKSPSTGSGKHTVSRNVRANSNPIKQI